MSARSAVEQLYGGDPYRVKRDQVVDPDQLHRDQVMIITTHHIDEIIPEIVRVVLLDHGRIVADGPKAQVLDSGALSTLYQTELFLRRSCTCHGVSRAPRQWPRSPLRKRFPVFARTNPLYRYSQSSTLIASGAVLSVVRLTPACANCPCSDASRLSSFSWMSDFAHPERTTTQSFRCWSTLVVACAGFCTSSEFLKWPQSQPSSLSHMAWLYTSPARARTTAFPRTPSRWKTSAKRTAG